MIKLGINFDEISDNLDIAIACMDRKRVKYGELRTVNGKNFCFWNEDEIQTFNRRLGSTDIEVVAASSPLFKWYQTPDAEEIQHDSFGFNPRQSESEKQNIIEQTLRNAKAIGIARVRIFSELGTRENAGHNFASSPLLGKALNIADSLNIDLYLENEPVCTINRLDDYAELFRANTHPRLKMWLDISNFEEVNDTISEDFLIEFADRIGYIHVKDFVREKGRLVYVPAGDGQVDYAAFFMLMVNHIHHEIIITVETHAFDSKEIMSERAIDGLREILLKVKGAINE